MRIATPVKTALTMFEIALALLLNGSSVTSGTSDSAGERYHAIANSVMTIKTI